MPRALHIESHLTLSQLFGGGYDYHPHVTDGETITQRG